MRRPLVPMLLVLLGAAPAAAARLPPPNKLALVQAQCAGTPPGPCAPAFAFAGGTAVMKTQKHPKPTCPRTGMPTETAAGSVTMVGVTREGASYDGALPVQVVLSTTFGADPNGNCELSGLHTGPIPSIEGTVECRSGRCKGALFPIACLPKSCADTPITSELISLKVLDGTAGAQPVATVGTLVIPARTDAP